jgi:hypothetical protein
VTFDEAREMLLALPGTELKASRLTKKCGSNVNVAATQRNAAADDGVKEYL